MKICQSEKVGTMLSLANDYGLCFQTRRGKIIETNLSKINVKKFDMEFEVDPLFSKTSAAFDEGGTGGLLLNHLR